MILVDTSIWVEHARQGNERLVDLLVREQVIGHPFVIGELALGGFKPSQLRLLEELPEANVATTGETLRLIARRRLAGRGIGYVDAHLVASALLTEGASVWTRDRSLCAVADELGVLAAAADRGPSS